ncbi:MAG: folylpolyglutamate synthase/dihydrofolate synthase family protein [Ruminococcus sp.]|nr:folylpolyglutamate synthase/dihydrofolate synthase family protein [Ruminococcus sp.]
MTYEQALDSIHSLLTFGSRPGLDRMRRFLKELGDPQDKLKYIHVAGTNGKGSVCALLSSVLVAAGYKTGLFISPYITDFRERIQINNRMVDREVLTDAVERTLPVLKRLNEQGVVITEFEYVNALQFLIHAEAECDIVVLETGMGGLLDCTNVIEPPLCAVLTAIGLDHTAVLGDTVSAIAAQKCGIIKENSAVVTSAQCDEAMQVIEQTARIKHVPLLTAENVSVTVQEETLSGTVMTWNGTQLRLRLAGAHQIENAKTALAALDYLRLNDLLDFTDTDVQNGFLAAVNPARLELLSQDPVVLLDGAHNPNGMEALTAAVKRFLPDTPVYCVIGMMADKDIDSALSLMQGIPEAVFTAPVDNPRAIAPEALAEKIKPVCSNVTACGSATEAFDKALALAKANNGAVLVCGSLYLAGELRPYMLSCR